jgi:hypothetical protein
MAKKDFVEEEMFSIVEPKVEAVLPVPATPEKRFTFDQWAAQKVTVKEHHKSGLKSFCKNPNKLRTMNEWDKVFESY